MVPVGVSGQACFHGAIAKGLPQSLSLLKPAKSECFTSVWRTVRKWGGGYSLMFLKP